ncbi:hypothetical protein [Streptomyces botrytidirepellens]|uniref:Uncharacterized protein n=1 Tax=Streptomyces botrytidirepellens TaxID=2486417 RepID=A0A3M8VK01_9ACTN|nr:hypothetical protein [Streptomyces botrytidirepellens]RNG17904.1 hypothetical protein EEJ42_28715 [Streptomyces botrytidirepellens]
MLILQGVLLVLLLVQAIAVVRHAKSWELEMATTAGFIAGAVLFPPGEWQLTETALRVFVAVGIAPTVERVAMWAGVPKEGIRGRSGLAFWCAAALSALLGAVVASVDLS